MYQYIFSDEDKKIIEEKTNNENKKQKLIDDFADIDRKYKTTLEDASAENLGLEKLTFKKLSDEEIKKQAENSLADYKTESLQDIESKYNTQKEQLDQTMALKEKNANSQKAELESKYASLKADASNDALKRGLARSSIIVNTLEAFDNSMLDNFMKINQELTNSIDSLTSQKNLLEQQKQNALSSFDISYAVKLNDKIEKINKDLAEQEEKVIKYNNEIAEKEAEYKRKKQQDARDFVDYVEENGIGMIEAMKSHEKYKLAQEYFLNLPVDQALAELQGDSSYKTQLGTYYNKLLVALKDAKK